MVTRLPQMFKIPVPTPFRVGAMNAYLLKGDALTLIDTGPRTVEAEVYLRAALTEHGYQFADIERIIITHHHIDHIGLTGTLAQETDAEILCHPWCVPFMEDQQGITNYIVEYITSIYGQAAVPMAIQSKIEGSGDWYEKFGTFEASVTRTLDEGDSIEMGGIDWQVFHTPGHAGDLICFYDPISRILLANDHLIKTISSNPILEPPQTPDLPRPKRLIEYIYHLERIAKLDIEIAYSGHGNEIEDVSALVAKRINFHQKRADKILSNFEGRPRHLWDMTEQLFSHVGLDDKFLAVSEVLGHIDILEADHRLARTVQDGVIYWQPT